MFQVLFLWTHLINNFMKYWKVERDGGYFILEMR